MTYSNKILMELTKHQRLNASQLAMKISHDKTKTGYIADFMVRNDKLTISDQDVNDEKAYEITDTSTTAHNSRPAPAATQKQKPKPEPASKSKPEPAVEPAPTETTTPQHTEKVVPDDSSVTHIADVESCRIMIAVPQIHPEDDISYGLLNTGQLIFVRHGIPILISPHTTAAIRDLLNSEAHR